MPMLHGYCISTTTYSFDAGSATGFLSPPAVAIVGAATRLRTTR